MLLPDLYFRDFVKEDLPFIKSSWYKSTSKLIRPKLEVDEAIFKKEYESLISEALMKSTITIASSTDDKDHIYGYIVGDVDTIHYCYVRHIVRRYGIAGALFGEYMVTNFDRPLDSMTATHKPRFELPQNFIYNPFIFLKGSTCTY